MPIYRYKALNKEGLIVKGEIELSNLEEFFNYLYQEGLIPLKYKTSSLSLKFLFKKVKRKDLADFCHNLAFLLSAGVPLLSALKDLYETVNNPILKRKIAQIIAEILRGTPISEAFKQTQIFPPVVIFLIKIGEETGRIDKTLEDASKHLYRIDEIVSQTKRAMMYPIFVLFSISTAFLFWMLYVLPKILDVFKQMHITLPLPTLILMKIVDVFQKHYVLIFSVSLIVILFLLILYKHQKTQHKIEKILLKLPFIGFVKRSSFLAFFFEYFSLLLEAGVDILRSFDLMYSSLNTQLTKKIILNIKEKITEGITLSDALKEEKIFNSFDIRLINVGEKTGKLNEQMKLLSNYYFNEVQNLIQTISKILEPLIIAIAGMIFLIIIIALIGPIYELISQIGKM
ncbi:type II secretion system F family protein [Thermodesulfobacterium sp. TA1]|uniref:type II secretion system F family protein n=1 Tax=Thermodesulfobacterium sp. TA1 TaxID=2234087 RepID=UPI0012318AC2|nr:type II secretion system F family protein [Thermodesulfobacterium sp. TA1]QER42613.1 type II secretion system F family protein [Thermodesulfobacterium sp. TA1]